MCMRLPFRRWVLIAVPAAIAMVSMMGGCSRKTPMFDLANPTPTVDLHSYARPQEWEVRHVHLDLDVDFNQKILSGNVRLSLHRGSGEAAPEIVLDTRDLHIEKAEYSVDDSRDLWTPAEFTLGESDPILGPPLRVKIPADAELLRIHYRTSPGAVALQWLEPSQTAGQMHPFLFSQSQAIQARSWIPLQDSPAVRITYSANIRAPKPLLAVMSASMQGPVLEKEGEAPRDYTEYRFRQGREIPSYLIALAVGDLAFANIDPEARKTQAPVKNGRIPGRTGIYAEPSVLDSAAREFEDTEEMIRTVEKRFGAYRWGRYDLLILPPSFPFGGMENPALTFATPTVIAGDKSLVALVAHELAHSWSGNLVTNATWRDFWLNEGFTVYLERRIIEDVYGRNRADMEAVLAYNELLEEMKSLAPRDQILYVDLAGRDPDEGFTGIPYEKGALFLSALEQAAGRDKFDVFLSSYFSQFSFRSITTQDFLNYLDQHLFRVNPGLETKVPVMEWITQPGLPEGHPVPASALLREVDEEARLFASGEKTADKIPFAQWDSLRQLRFLRMLPPQLSDTSMAELDRAFGLTQTGNSEVVSQWLLMAIRNDYNTAWPRLESFLVQVGRRKFLKPLYEELVKTPAGAERARAIYAKARAGYHPMATATIDGILNTASK